MLSKLSFRQLLLGVFLLIAVLLSAASLHALWTLDRLAAHSRDSGHHALALTENTQQLAERSVAMTRSARQYLVLDDPAFRKRYADAWRDARVSLDAVAAALPYAPSALFDRWHQAGEQAWDILQMPTVRNRNSARQQALEKALDPLPAVNEQLAEEVKQEVERRNAEILSELDQRRGVLKAQVIGSILLAALLASGFGLWLSRPLAQIEQAIDTLGENRYDQVIVVRGPSDLQRVGLQLNWLRQRLGDLEADKARFLRHISHELKTPLAALREGVSLLEDGVTGELNQDQREIAQILRHNTSVLQGQIEGLLRFNTAAFEARQLHRHTTDLLELVESQVDAQRLQWRARELSVTIVGKPILVELDPEKIGTVLANLLSNAIRYSPLKGEIRLELSKLPGLVRIDIHDQGVGVALADRERIFEPFYRGERQPSDVVRGSGIGLSIVHEYIAAHGGRIELLPDPVGAHFRIEFPHVFKS